MFTIESIECLKQCTKLTMNTGRECEREKDRERIAQKWHKNIGCEFDNENVCVQRSCPVNVSESLSFCENFRLFSHIHTRILVSSIARYYGERERTSERSSENRLTQRYEKERKLLASGVGRIRNTHIAQRQ